MINKSYGMSTFNINRWFAERYKTGGLVYVAGDLFSDATKLQRVLEGDTLKKTTPYSVFNPLTDNKANVKSNRPTAIDVFTGDTEVIVACDTIMAELDREDAGVMAELGFVVGINYMIDLLEAILDQEEYNDNPYKLSSLATKIEQLLLRVPKKEIVAHYSDIRTDTSNEYYITPAGYNHYVWGMIEAAEGVITRSSKDAMSYIEAKSKNDIQSMNEILIRNKKMNGKPIKQEVDDEVHSNEN